MNFEILKSRIKESASKAATVARTFQGGLDEMAAQDDYIHSADLNVKRKGSVASKEKKEAVVSSRGRNDLKNEKQEVVLHNSSQQQQKQSTTATNASSKAATAAQPHILQKSPVSNSQSQFQPASSSSLSSVPLLSVVQTTLNHKTNNNKNDSTRITTSSVPTASRSTIRPSDSLLRNGHPSDEEDASFLDMEQGDVDQDGEDETSDLEDDDDEDGKMSDDDDPILSAIRSSTATSGAKKRRGKKPKRKPQKLHDQQTKKKNVHRFIQDLENRMSMPESSSNHSCCSTQDEEAYPLIAAAESSSGDPLTNVIGGFLSSLGSRLTTQLQQHQQQQEQPALSRSKRRVEPKQQQQQQPAPSDMENFEIVDSTAVFDQNELKQLSQLQRQDYFCIVISFLRAHPRESFILFTLVLGAFVYFYSRRGTVEDDVT